MLSDIEAICVRSLYCESIAFVHCRVSFFIICLMNPSGPADSLSVPQAGHGINFLY